MPMFLTMSTRSDPEKSRFSHKTPYHSQIHISIYRTLPLVAMESKPMPLVGVDNINKMQKGHAGNALPRKTKRSGPMHILRVALFALHLRSGKSKSTSVEVASKWTKLLGSMRPLHIQCNKSPPRFIEAMPNAEAPELLKKAKEQFEAQGNQSPRFFNAPRATQTREPLMEIIEQYEPPFMSPSQASTSSSSSIRSQYASALNLQELDESDGHEDERDSYYDDKIADEMIDIKAEQFIAQFYQQMELQDKTLGGNNDERGD